MTTTRENATAAGTVDSAQLLGLTTPAARIVMLLFVASNFVFAFASLDDVKHAAPVLVAAVLVSAAAFLLVSEHADPFPLAWTAAILGAVVLSTILVALQLPDAGPIGRGSWHLGADTWLLFFLALRRRPGAAWLGYALMVACTIAWSVSVGRSALSAVSSVQTHAAILLVATLFAINLRRTARQISEFENRAVGSAIEAAEGATAVEIRMRRVAELRESTGHLLGALVTDGPPRDPQAKRGYAVTEAELRDGVRGHSLMTPTIAAASTAARERGVEVTLLDDRSSALASDDAMDRLSTIVGTTLAALSEGSATIRLGPKGRRVAVSIVTSGPNAQPRIELDENGDLLSDHD